MPKFMHAYHQSGSILFQFILAEILESSEKLHTLKQVCSSKVSNEEIFRQMINLLEELCGCSRRYMRIFSWNLEDGALARLKSYAALLAQCETEGDKTIQNLHTQADRLWLHALNIRDEIQGMDSHSNWIDTQENNFLKLFSAYERMTRLICRIARQFRDDENVLFFFVRHYEKYALFFGADYVPSIFRGMFRKGIQEAGHFLLKRYASRGFDHLLPAISSRISELQGKTL